MKKRIPDTDYLTNNRDMQLYITEEFAEKIVPANDSVRLLNQLVEDMEIKPLERAYKRSGRPFGTSPRTMLKIVLYGGMERVDSCRRLDVACQRDINFIWLLNGEKAPNYQAIQYFRKHILSECGEDIFCELVQKLAVLGEIKFEHLFVDGTKIEANANKYTWVWAKSTNKYEENNNKKLEKLLAEIEVAHKLSAPTPEELLTRLEQKFGDNFVKGRGKRKSQFQRHIELLREKLSKKHKYSTYQETFRGRNSFSKTDKDATFMRMKEDHMKNGQLKPGYNLQIAVEGEYITGIDLSSERSDQQTLIPLLNKMEEKLGKAYQDVTADAGYESEENYTYFEDKDQNCYIKPLNYERSKTKKYKSNMALRENMPYDETTDTYTCQAGRKLTPRYEGVRKSKTGFESTVTYYECESCEGCPHKKSCTRAKGNRKLQVSKKFIEQRKKSLGNITSTQGILLRMNRSIQVEGAFGVLKQDYGFRRFLHRGLTMVSTEFFIRAMAYNVNKYHNKFQKQRTGVQLHDKLSA